MLEKFARDARTNARGAARRVARRITSRNGSAAAVPSNATPDEARAARQAKLAELERKFAESLAAEQALEAERFLKYSIPPATPGRLARIKGMQLDASATRLYHRVEKGFSLPAPKRPFGAKAVPGLTKVLGRKVPQDALYVTESKMVLDALEAWNERGERHEAVAPRGDSLPTNPLDAETTAQFITSRHSIRDFDQRKVSHELITEAVRVAMYAPSVCNRQGWRAHWFDAPEDLARILPLHSGSAGFADNIPGVFVLTYDIRAFEGTNERNQGWIDGGLFSMNLMLALHGLGLGSVPLNWSRSNAASDKLRETAGIPDHENILMLLAAGHPAEGYRVARSARRPIEQILRFGTTKD